MKQIFLMMLGLSTALFADFSKTGEVVTDNISGLQWKDDAIGSAITWTEAINYCENLTFDTHSDWRLPNIRELASLIVDSNAYPSIDTSVFEHTESHHYWSSTTYAGDPDRAFNIRFRGGNIYKSNKTNYLYVRCVRAGE